MLTIWLQACTIAFSTLSVDIAAQTSIAMFTTFIADYILTVITRAIWERRIECFVLAIWLQVDTIAFSALSVDIAAQTSTAMATTSRAASGLAIVTSTIRE